MFLDQQNNPRVLQAQLGRWMKMPKQKEPSRLERMRAPHCWLVPGLMQLRSLGLQLPVALLLLLAPQQMSLAVLATLLEQPRLQQRKVQVRR